MSISFVYNSVTYTASELLQGTRATDGPDGFVYPRRYQVAASDPNIHPNVVYIAAVAQRTGGTVTFTGRLPVRRDVDGSYSCQTVDVTPVDGSNNTYDYVASFALDQFSGSDNPLDDPPEVDWGGIETSEPYDLDADNKAAVNTAGERFDPAPERVAGQDAVTITINTATWSPAMGSMYSYTTNSNTMWGTLVAQGQALMGRISARKVREEGVTFWRVTYPITFKTDWKQTLLNVGYNTRNGTNTLTPIMAKDTNTGTFVPIQQPRLISTDGSSVYTGALTGTNVPTVTLRPYLLRDWSPLNIPSPF
jgi:hypothetical protein